MSNNNTSTTRIRSTTEVSRDLSIPLWHLERVVREQGLTIRHLAGVRAWTDDDVARLGAALAARAVRANSRRRAATMRPEIRS